MLLHERVDEIPLLITAMQRMELVALLNDSFPTHGHWQGLSLGALTVRWRSHILSPGDPRRSHVQAWADQRRSTLTAALGRPLRAPDLAEDRLAAGLRYLRQDPAWQAFEKALHQRSLRVYAWEPEQIRLASSTASS